MMKLSCKDMGADCDYEATGNSPEEVKSKMMDHAMSDHSDMMGSMSQGEKDKLMEKMDNMMVKV